MSAAPDRAARHPSTAPPRVAARRGPSRPRVALRPAVAGDCRQVWLWRNDEVTRLASFDSAPIPFEAHERWFAQSLERADRKLWVVEVDGQGAGVARLDLAGGTATVSIHLAPEWRGHGVGPEALIALDALARDHGVSQLLASVKTDNAASLRAFQKAGFEGPVVGPVATLVKALRDH